MVRKSLLKILQAESLAGISQKALIHKILEKLTAWHDFLASSHVLLTCLFRENSSRELVAKCTDFQLNLSFHQLNTKLNTIKSHKIQGIKLK